MSESIFNRGLYLDISPNYSILLYKCKYQNCFHKSVQFTKVIMTVKVNETICIKSTYTHKWLLHPFPPSFSKTVFVSENRPNTNMDLDSRKSNVALWNIYLLLEASFSSGDVLTWIKANHLHQLWKSETMDMYFPTSS